MRTLIVGTGRSGTRWITDTLNSQGVSAAHQAVRHAHVLGESFSWPDVEVVCSFEAVPIMSRFECRRLLVVRNPDDTIGSWLRMGAFGDEMRSEFALWAGVLDRRFPGVLEEATRQDRAAHYWVVWNMYASMWADDISILDRIDETDWFDVVWPDVEKTGYPQAGLRSALRDTVDRYWQSLL